MLDTVTSPPTLEQIIQDALAKNPGWLDEGVPEIEAAAITRFSPATLKTKRSRGGGPIYTERCGRIRYIRRDLFAWLHEGRRASTSA